MAKVLKKVLAALGKPDEPVAAAPAPEPAPEVVEDDISALPHQMQEVIRAQRKEH